MTERTVYEDEEQNSREYIKLASKTVDTIKIHCEEDNSSYSDFELEDGRKVSVAYDGVFADLVIIYPGGDGKEQIEYEISLDGEVKKGGFVDPKLVSSETNPVYYTDDQYIIDDLEKHGYEYTFLSPLTVDIEELRIVQQLTENPRNAVLVDKIPHLPRI